MTDWNARYIEADTPWDKGMATPIISELMEKLPQFFQAESRVLIPGCGRGHDAQPFLNAGMQVTGVDISSLALSDAAEVYGYGGNVRWLANDIFAMPDTHIRHYDIIWEHTCYCAIQPDMRESYVDAVVSLLKPNAYFIGTFFIETGVPLEEGPPFYTSRDDVFANFDRKFHLVWEGKPSKSYEGREGREWVMIWRKPITG